MENDREPGPLAEEKIGATSDPEGVPQPDAAEVESARVLENDAAPELEPIGLSRDEIRRYAHAYVALDVGRGSTGDFVAWVRDQL